MATTVIIISAGMRLRRWLLCSLLLAVPASAQPLSSVADLRYGVVLYEYYQGNYLDALAELMVAEARGGIRGHRENPQLIAGGISLAYGMHSKAAAIFDDLLDDDTPVEVRNAAWYYLAKLLYLQSDWDGSAASLDRLDGSPDSAISTRLQSLQFNLALRRNDLDAAAALLLGYPKSDFMWSYHAYNLAAAYSRAQLPVRAQAYFQALLQHVRDNFNPDPMAPASVEQQRVEALALYDKAQTALGYSLLQQGRQASAISSFSGVRKDSDYRHEALLGYGWSAFQQGDYPQALTPWQLANAGPLDSPAVQESLLAVPYVYEQIGAEQQALQAYQHAEQRLQSEFQRLQALAADIEAGQLPLWLQAQTRGFNWLALEQELDLELEQELPANPRQLELARLFARNRFQASLQEWRDVRALQQQLARWQEQLEVYQWSWQERYDLRQQKQALVAGQPWREQGAQLQQQRDALRQRLDSARQQQDYLALASGETAANWRTVQRMQANVERLQAAGKPVAEYVPAVELYRGLVLWQAAQDFPAALWRNEKNLRAADAALTSLAQDRDRVEVALQSAADIAPFAGRIRSLQQRLTQQTRQLASARASIEGQLAQQVVVYLDEQRQQLRQYLAQARLAKARLYDKALEAQP
ncbi:MAG: tetratricopeptide repeat protein [Gammaproteobacteria bacterium]|nr:tetratricopeptide repeat protein [Gammaproteobacteria bacterium]